ncbi:bud neck involved protein, partial [Teratosphaeriaceae sp. CCFEE 6253]
MLRKMGRGAKKSARSIKGLFRPKSVIGVPAADGPVQVGGSALVQPSVAQVSMVTVEAERHKVNVNADVGEKAGGVTAFPKLERNSIDAATATMTSDPRGSADGSDSFSRRSIVGSDKDRAE